MHVAAPQSFTAGQPTSSLPGDTQSTTGLQPDPPANCPTGRAMTVTVSDRSPGRQYPEPTEPGTCLHRAENGWSWFHCAGTVNGVHAIYFGSGSG